MTSIPGSDLTLPQQQWQRQPGCCNTFTQKSIKRRVNHNHPPNITMHFPGVTWQQSPLKQTSIIKIMEPEEGFSHYKDGGKSLSRPISFIADIDFMLHSAPQKGNRRSRNTDSVLVTVIHKICESRAFFIQR